MDSPVAYLNGQFVPFSGASIPLNDLGFTTGVTIVDNCRTYARKLFRWPDHLARFRRDCAACHVTLSVSDRELTAAAEELVRRNSGVRNELQVVTFATPGPPTGPPTFGMYCYPVPLRKYRPFFTSGVHVVTAGCHPLGADSLLSPRVKHRSRLVWWLAEHAVPDGAIAVLTADPAGETFAETGIGNLAFVVNGAVVANDPALVLDGISIRVVRELCTSLAIPFREEPLTRHLLTTASEVLLTGTGFGLASVRQVDGVTVPWQGPVYRRLLAAWSAIVGQELSEEFIAAG